MQPISKNVLCEHRICLKKYDVEENFYYFEKL